VTLIFDRLTLENRFGAYVTWWCDRRSEEAQLECRSFSGHPELVSTARCDWSPVQNCCRVRLQTCSSPHVVLKQDQNTRDRPRRPRFISWHTSVASLSTLRPETVNQSLFTPVKCDLINIATLHWSQLLGIFVTLHQTLRWQTRDRSMSHTRDSIYACNIITPMQTRNSAIADKPRDAFKGQSRSSNMVPFHTLGMVFSYCPIATLSVRRTVFRYSTSKMPWPWKPG